MYLQSLVYWYSLLYITGRAASESTQCKGRDCFNASAGKKSALTQDESSGCGCGDTELIDGVKYWLDVIFVVDSSDVVIDEDFSGIKSLIESFGGIQIGPTPQNPKQFSRVAVINTGEQAEVIANLTSFSNGTELQRIVAENLHKKGGAIFNVQAGLQAAQNVLLAEAHSATRREVPKVVVLFSTVPIICNTALTEGSPRSNNGVLCSLGAYLREETTLITVGLKMAGSSKFPYIDIADKCNTLDNTLDMMLNLLRALCRANCFCLSPYTQFTVQDQCKHFAECVFVHQLSLSYASAKQTCKEDGATLANVFSKEKRDFLDELHMNADFYPYWIGLKESLGNRTWDSGEILGIGDYVDWCAIKGQPDESKGECVFAYQCHGFQSAWFTSKCGSMLPSYYFACQKTACSVNNYCD